MAPSAPSAKSAGSPNADYGYADESLPPQGQQGQSWYQSAGMSLTHRRQRELQAHILILHLNL